MNDIKIEALELVEELNDKTQNSENGNFLPYEFRSYGWQNSAIYFMGTIIWTEENSGLEKTQSLRSFIIEESKKVFKNLSDKMIYIE